MTIDYAAESAMLPDLAPVVAELDHPLVFATVSGAHLYGFPSVDSDVDLRGAHLLPVKDLVGLGRPVETTGRMWVRDGVEMDLVTHDLCKFARLLLHPNGYVLEQLLSPLVVHTTETHDELAALTPRLITSAHAGHYQGFAATQWRLFAKSGELKPLLYTFRTLLTGIHLMRTGEVVAHLPTLAELYSAPGYLADLMAAKANAEHSDFTGLDGAPSPDQLEADVEALQVALETAQAGSRLPEVPSAGDEVNRLVVDSRIASDVGLG